MLRALLSWAYAAVWPGVVALVIVVLAFAWWLTPNAAESAAQAQSRTRAAEAWVQKNSLDATVTCFPNYCYCDVVPRDARAPFRLECCGYCTLEARNR